MHTDFNKQRGMTLIEMMISMTISLFLVLGAVTVYNQGRANYQATEGIARVQENMRFALTVMEPDVRLAGFWGQNNNTFNVDTTGVGVTCNGNVVTNWALDVNTSLDALNNVDAGNAEDFTDDCPTFGDGIVGNTDVLMVRHASGQTRPLSAGAVQVQSNRIRSALFDDGNIPATFGAGTGTFDYAFNVWYIGQDSANLDDIPSLRRLTLNGGQMVDEEVIAGVENMQIQFGVDTLDGSGNPDGQIDRYVDPEDPIIANSTVMAVRIWMLLRAEYEERGFVDGASYTPLDGNLGDIAPNDSFRRMQITKTIFVRNFNRDVGPL
ncbi:MAG: PilW family protein [Gammaproteobacteria bacterium]|nr:PilW family protein [Gammaproteobacteria bacterium]MDP6617038.1 PilW family protein [Gammaproteobacteria bacterium]MDP6695070.1 PilW family protein [Gammaproteobacteria bacterium]MDP7041615.1 PilW family protein [Gammaproteobacteria bacterium]